MIKRAIRRAPGFIFAVLEIIAAVFPTSEYWAARGAKLLRIGFGMFVMAKLLALLSTTLATFDQTG